MFWREELKWHKIVNCIVRREKNIWEEMVILERKEHNFGFAFHFIYALWNVNTTKHI